MGNETVRRNRQFLLSTYRVLRIGIVASVFMLGVSLVFEIVDSGPLLDSISAYYYTPVRSVLVGGLMAIGVSLIAIQGRSDLEDIFLNLAGMFAPVVALVPTRPDGLPDDAQLPQPVLDGITNNMIAYLVTGIAVLLLIVFLNYSKPGSDTDRRGVVIGSVAVYAVVIGAGITLYLTFDGVKPRSHGLAAIAMFVCFAVVAFINGRSGRNRPEYRRWYRAIAVLMVAGGIIFGFSKFAFEMWGWGSEWNQIFWLEVTEIALFGIFWLIQTVQFWDVADPNPAQALTGSAV